MMERLNRSGQRRPDVRRSRRTVQRGFTLVELMVTIVITAILAGIAMPSATEMMLSGKLTMIVNSMVSSVQLARSEAIKRNARVTLCASSNGSTCTGGWKDGWIVRALDGTVISTQAPLPNGFKVWSGNTSIVFNSTGLASSSSWFYVCRATPTVGKQARYLDISATGRARVQTWDWNWCG
ncbi:MAG: type fimbrial biosis protein FimT [Pseudomonadota bacterium]|nr:type fimbrial biosis protein FimT [Pseudomonadota bacterium]